MKACIYARTTHKDKSHDRTTLDNQVEACRELARLHNLTVEPEHIFTDINMEGHEFPSCWDNAPGEAGRPALGALVMAVEEGDVQRVIVHRLNRLGTSSQILMRLADMFKACGASVVISPEELRSPQEPSEQYAISLMRGCLQVDTESEREMRARERSRRLEEIDRLQARIARLEAEIAELDYGSAR